MYYINELSRKRNYDMPQEPKFKTKASRLTWLKQQALNAKLANIKAVIIQIRDIKAFIYTDNDDLLVIYNSFKPFEGYDDNEYVTIYNIDSRSKKAISYIIESQWLTSRDIISQTDTETIKEEIDFLINRMHELEKRRNDKLINQCYEHCKFRKEELERILLNRSQGLKLV